MMGSIALFAALHVSSAIVPPPDANFGIARPAYDASTLLARRDDDDDDDDEADEDDERERDIEREKRDRDREMRDQHRMFRDAFRDHRRFERDDDEGAPKGSAVGRDGRVSLAVNGPVTVRLRVQSGAVEVVPADKPQIVASVSGTRLSGDLQLVQRDNLVELRNAGKALKRGNLRLEVPRGTNVDFDSTSGDITARGVGGDVRVRTMSGDVKVQGARKLDVETISGDVTVEANSSAKLHTVSGNVVATTADPAAHVDFESASGSFDWTGVCAKGCHLAVETVSGDVKLRVDPKSSFELAYSSHSGELRDELKLQMKRAPKRKHGEQGGWAEAVFGNGEGLIECDAFSGDLQIQRK